MAIHWQIQFRSLRLNTLYIANIYDATYTGSTPVQLLGAANPFETQEDEEDDMFTPVRLQTGYLRIFDNGKDANGNAFDWRDIIPQTDTDRPVTLTRVVSGQVSVVWQGYMQSQNFGATLYGNPQEREFPLQCCLTTLDTLTVSTNIHQPQTFAGILAIILNSIPVLTIGNIYFQGGNSAKEWLLKKVDCRNFLDENEQGVFTAKYTYSEIFEEICRFWGWTARTYGQDIYFMAADDTTIPVLLKTTLNDLPTLTNATEENFPLTTFTVSDHFANYDNTDTQVMDASDASVQTSVADEGSKIIECWPDAVSEVMEDDIWSQVGDSGDNKHVYVTPDYGNVDNGNLYAYRSDTNDARFCMLNEGESYDIGSLMSAIRIMKPYHEVNGEPTVYANIETKYAGVFGDGIFVLNGTVYKDTGRYNDEGNDKYMWIRFGIGYNGSAAMWYDGDMWSTHKTKFRVRIGRDGNIFNPVYISGSFTIESQYVRCLNPREGYILVEFLGSEDLGNDIINICNFSVDFKRAHHNYNWFARGINLNSRRWVNSEQSHDYKANNGNAKHIEWSTSTMFASDNRSPYGYGLVIDPTTNQYIVTVSYGSTLARPEQHIADRVVAFWSVSKRRIDANLLASGSGGAVGSMSPSWKVTVDGTTCYPYSISHIWRDDVMRVGLIEM